MIGRTNVGGGDNLNFKIVGGTAQPSNPKENTIWVNTNTAIHAWDFSATEPHRRSKNKNLNVYPYYKTTNTNEGITFTDNNDGTITANGTVGDGASSYFLCSGEGADKNECILSPGTYTLSGGVGTKAEVSLSLYYTTDDWTTTAGKIQSDKQPVTFTITQTVKARVFIRVSAGVQLTNAVFRPQVEKGSTATSFIKGDATGQVWIKTSDTSPAAFNAIKKNNVMVYPWNCYQYINGAWVKKTAKSYIGGEWKPWAQYLFNLGDENTALTGGWKGYAVRLASGSDGAQGAEAPLVAKQSNGGIKLYNDYGGGIHRCVNKINLSGYDVLTLNGTMYNHNANKNWCSLYVWSAIGTYYPQNVAASVGPSSGMLTGDITLDISSLNGEYYVGFGLHDNTNDNYIIMNSLSIS